MMDGIEGAVLGAVNAVMEELGITYAYGGFAGVPTYPYYVGEYTERTRSAAEHRTQGTMMLRGWSKSMGELEQTNARIRRAFTARITKSNGATVACDTDLSTGVRAEPDGLKTTEIQIGIRAYGQTTKG